MCFQHHRQRGSAKCQLTDGHVIAARAARYAPGRPLTHRCEGDAEEAGSVCCRQAVLAPHAGGKRHVGDVVNDDLSIPARNEGGAPCSIVQPGRLYPSQRRPRRGLHCAATVPLSFDAPKLETTSLSAPCCSRCRLLAQPAAYRAAAAPLPQRPPGETSGHKAARLEHLGLLPAGHRDPVLEGICGQAPLQRRGGRDRAALPQRNPCDQGRQVGGSATSLPGERAHPAQRTTAGKGKRPGALPKDMGSA